MQPLVRGVILACMGILVASRLTPVFAPGHPYVISSSLSEGSVVSPSAPVEIVLEFSVPMDWQSVYDAFTLTPNKGGYVLTHGSTNLTIRLTNLQPGTKYTIIIASTASDYQGNTMATPYALSFTTWGTPPKTSDEGLSSIEIILILLAFSVGIVALYSLVVVIRQRRKKKRNDQIAGVPSALREKEKKGNIIQTQEKSEGQPYSSSSKILRCGVCRRVVLKKDRVTCKKCTGVFHKLCAEKLNRCPVCTNKRKDEMNDSTLVSPGNRPI